MSKLNDLLNGVKSSLSGTVGKVASATVPEWVMILAGVLLICIIAKIVL